jgi:hypothetical protein
MFVCVLYMLGSFYGSCGTWETLEQCNNAGRDAARGVPNVTWSCGPNRTYRPRGY